MTDHSLPSQERSHLSRFFVDFATLFLLTNVGLLLGTTICSIARLSLDYGSIREAAHIAENWVLVIAPIAGFVMGILLCVRRIYLRSAIILGAVGTLLMFRYSVPVPDGTFGGIALLIFFAFLVLNLACSLALATLLSLVRIKWKASMPHQLNLNNNDE